MGFPVFPLFLQKQRVLLGVVLVHQLPLEYREDGVVQERPRIAGVSCPLGTDLGAALPELASDRLTLSIDADVSRARFPFFLFPVIALLLGYFLDSGRRRRSRVKGKSRFRSSGRTVMGPGV
jgi:hypothetical protein